MKGSTIFKKPYTKQRLAALNGYDASSTLSLPQDSSEKWRFSSQKQKIRKFPSLELHSNIPLGFLQVYFANKGLIKQSSWSAVLCGLYGSSGTN